jgi:hypothetical protein
MKALSILALAAATFAAPMAWAGQTAVTVTQVAGPMTSVTSDQTKPFTISFVNGILIFILQDVSTR